MEHLEHFKLGRDPFSNEPDLRFFFESDSHKDAQRRIERSIRQGKGLTVMTGPHGAGKSLLARRLFDGLEEEMFETVLMVMLPGATDARTVLGRLALELGAENPGEERSSLLAQIYEQLAIVREDGRNFVLIIDDAQILGAEVMAEIGGLLSMEYEGRRMLSLLLVGSSEIDSCLAADVSLEQRVDVRVRLQAMDFACTKQYVDHRIDLVSGPASLISEEALEALFKSSRGRPRLINTLADNALFEAYLVGRLDVHGADIERAASDLGLGPEVSATILSSEVPTREASLDMEGAGSRGADMTAEEAGDQPSVALNTIEPNDADVQLDLDVPSRMQPLDFDGDDLWLDVEGAPGSGTELDSAEPLSSTSPLDEGTLDLEFEWTAESVERGSEFDPPSLPVIEAAREVSCEGTGFGASPPSRERRASPQEIDPASEVDEIFAELLED